MNLRLRDGFLLLAEEKRAIAEDEWHCRNSAVLHESFGIVPLL